MKTPRLDRIVYAYGLSVKVGGGGGQMAYLVDLALAAKAFREAQRAYFANRSPVTLAATILAASELDAILTREVDQ